MTTISSGYVLVVFVILVAGGADDTSSNIVRFAIAGFLMMIAVVIVVIFIHYLKPARRGDWQGLLPKHVAKVTLASVLGIIWICIELWARTTSRHYAAPTALVHAGIDAFLWLASLSDVMRFERTRAERGPGGSEVGIRTNPRGRRAADRSKDPRV